MVGNKRTPQQAAFFQDLKVWSEIKLRILEKYVDAYHRIRGSRNAKLFYVDGFAGAGHYGDDPTERREGSPVLLAKVAQRIADSDKQYRLICINVERDPEFFADLQSALLSFDPALVRALPGSFEELLPAILKEIGVWPAVFFLDPFGPSPIKLPNLRPLLARDVLSAQLRPLCPSAPGHLHLSPCRVRTQAGPVSAVAERSRKSFAPASRPTSAGNAGGRSRRPWEAPMCNAPSAGRKRSSGPRKHSRSGTRSGPTRCLARLEQVHDEVQHGGLVPRRGLRRG